MLRFAALLLSICTLGVAVVACGGDTSNSTTNNKSSSNGSSGILSTAFPCSLASQQEVSTALGTEVIEPEPSAGSDPSCHWTPRARVGDYVNVFITVLTKQSLIDELRDKATSNKAQTLKGYSGEAVIFRLEDYEVTAYAVKGNTILKVYVENSAKIPQLEPVSSLLSAAYKRYDPSAAH